MVSKLTEKETYRQRLAPAFKNLRGGDRDAGRYQDDRVRGGDLRSRVGVGVLEPVTDANLFGSLLIPERHPSPYPLPSVNEREFNQGDTMDTVTLRNGRQVLAKMHQGELCSVKYANRTQADRKQAELGNEWEVCRFLGRPFYVTRKA